MINRIVLVGRLVEKPELRYTGNGVAVAHFTLAVDRPFKNQQGERETDFIDIVAWRSTAEFAANYLDRGRWAAVDGRLQLRSYQTQEGRTRKVTEVIADSVQSVGPRPESQEGTPAAPSQHLAGASQQAIPSATDTPSPSPLTGGRVAFFDNDFDDEDDPFAEQ